jgi:hypothetical protein
MTLNLGTAFDDALLTLAGFDPTIIDSNSVNVTMVDPDSETTVVRCTATAVINTSDLMALLTEYAKPAITTPIVTDPTAPADPTDPVTPTDPTTTTDSGDGTDTTTPDSDPSTTNTDTTTDTSSDAPADTDATTATPTDAPTS